MGTDVKYSLPVEPWVEQTKVWPSSGRHVMAHYDDESIVVYQAYRPSIGRWVLEHQRFGGEFSMTRMTWIKPNFLWMMYRSDWARSEGQEVVLAIHLRRDAFDAFLAGAVHSSYVEEVYGTPEEWKRRVKTSSVRLQWDPDHGPSGEKLERRAIQIGLRGDAVERYVESTVRIEDATPFVVEQRTKDRADLLTPRERPYPVTDPDVATRLGVSLAGGGASNSEA